MMIIQYITLFLLTGLSLTKMINEKISSINILSEDSLSMDEAYFILQNDNYLETLFVFANQLACEECDLEQILIANPNENDTAIIDTKYPYDLQVRSSTSIFCTFTSYQFDEHGTYLLRFGENRLMTTNQCSIKQIGNPSNYSTPVILAIFVFFLYVVLVQFFRQIQRRGYLKYLYQTIQLEPLLINHNSSTTSIIVEENNQEEPTNRPITMDNSPSVNSSPSSNARSDTDRVLPRRLRGLDTFRGFSLMVMIFVNYGGKIFLFFQHQTKIILRLI